MTNVWQLENGSKAGAPRIQQPWPGEGRKRGSLGGRAGTGEDQVMLRRLGEEQGVPQPKGHRQVNAQCECLLF